MRRMKKNLRRGQLQECYYRHFGKPWSLYAISRATCPSQCSFESSNDLLNALELSKQIDQELQYGLYHNFPKSIIGKSKQLSLRNPVQMEF
jgi:hypothetical protein